LLVSHHITILLLHISLINDSHPDFYSGIPCVFICIPDDVQFWGVCKWLLSHQETKMGIVSSQRTHIETPMLVWLSTTNFTVTFFTVIAPLCQ
jgi:hypothetical protein